ncbi:MAG: hypothetical protein U1A78_05555 [Polyangia bacterium]
MPISAHRLFRDGPLLVFEQDRSFALADAQAATAVYSQIIEEEGYLLLLLDFRRSSAADAEVRRHLAHWSKDRAARLCIAAVGGNFFLRTTLTLIVTAARLLGGRPLSVQFLATPEAAQAWLQQRGPVLAAALRRQAAASSP